MPNICTAHLVVVGYKDNVDEFDRILKAHYNYNTMEFSHRKHFYRIFDVWDIDEVVTGTEKLKEYGFDCAWSVYSCMFDGPGSYYYSSTTDKPLFGRVNEPEDRGLHLIHSTNILIEAKRLKLNIEIISEEPGMGFQERYRINESELLYEVETDYQEYYIGDNDTKESYEEECGEIPIEADVYLEMKANGEDVYYPPTMMRFTEDSPIFNIKRMVKDVMCKVVK